MLSGSLNCKSQLSCICYTSVLCIWIKIPSHIQHQEQCDHLLIVIYHSTFPTLLSQHHLRCSTYQGSSNNCIIHVQNWSSINARDQQILIFICTSIPWHSLLLVFSFTKVILDILFLLLKTNNNMIAIQFI